MTLNSVQNASKFRLHSCTIKQPKATNDLCTDANDEMPFCFAQRFLTSSLEVRPLISRLVGNKLISTFPDLYQSNLLLGFCAILSSSRYVHARRVILKTSLFISLPTDSLLSTLVGQLWHAITHSPQRSGLLSSLAKKCS